MKLVNYDTDLAFEYENGFFATSDHSRLGKILVHYELYKKTIDLPGCVVECGVFKGNSLLRFATFRELLENQFSRKIIGFDVFGDFPETDFEADKQLRDEFIQIDGVALSKENIEKLINYKEIKNIELVKGDVLKTIPEYIENNQQLKISLLHLDIDIYEPAKAILEYFWDRIVKGGVLILDDYATFPGETKAVDDFFKDKNIDIKKLPFGHESASYIIKQ